MSAKSSIFTQRQSPIMCLTQDGLPIPHLEQVRRLCAAGARWIQLRMKNADTAEWLTTAVEAAAICRQNGVVLVINDSVEIAIAAGAHGAHLGKNDLGWAEARRQLGPDKILGGTVNNASDAERASECSVLDYVGIGPWRFTKNKTNLSPVLGQEGVARLIPALGGIPGWAIGGVERSDLVAIKATGCAGAAVSSALFRDDKIGDNFRGLSQEWTKADERTNSVSQDSEAASNL